MTHRENGKKVLAVIQARMSSTRLPGKVLFPIQNRPMLSYMLERVSAAQRVDQVILATSLDPSDDPIAQFCGQEDVLCYRGSLDDVLDRYYQAAQTGGGQTIVRLTGDCPLLDPRIIDTMVEVYQKNQYDYIANTVPPAGASFPDGMDVEIFSMKNLERAWREAQKPSEREHVTFYFWKNSQIFSLHRHDSPKDFSGYRLTVDYPQDFEVVTKIFTELYPKNPLFRMEEVIDFLDRHPEIRDKNKNIAANLGWKPALEKDRKAGFTN